MSWFTGIIVYLMIFWVVIFPVLSYGNTPHKDGHFGTDGSAPENPRIQKKFLITSGLSALIWGIIYIMIGVEILDVHAFTAQLRRPVE